MEVSHPDVPPDGPQLICPAYKYYRQAVEESRKLAASLDTDLSPLLPREVVEEERKIANQGIEQLKQDIKVKDEQLHTAESRIRELQGSGSLLHIPHTRPLNLSQKHCYVVTSRRRSNVPKP